MIRLRPVETPRDELAGRIPTQLLPTSPLSPAQREERPEAEVSGPFSKRRSPRRREVGLDEEGETLLHGTIDLFFREGEQWFLIDYKSDSTEGRLDHLVEYYKPRVAYHAKFWTQTGAEAVAGLFFADSTREVWVREPTGASKFAVCHAGFERRGRRLVNSHYVP